ncbi:MAG: hypothetical protein IPJ79_09595 [Bacteroidetes bacterium]|nr:hypothetical protein [Bacteroidota bacterium]
MTITKAGVLKGHQSGIYGLIRDQQNNDAFYSASGDGKIVKWQSFINDVGELIATTPSPVYAIEINPDKKLLFAGTHKGQLHVIDLLLKKEVRCIDLHENGIFEIKFIAEKNLLVTGGGDGCINLLNAESLDLQSKFAFGSFKIRSACFYNLHKNLIVGCGDGGIAIIDLETLNPIHKFEAHQKDFSVNAVTVSPDGNYLLTGSRDAHLNVFDVKNNFKKVTSIPAHNYAIYKIQFSPNGKFFATASRDKTAKIWDAEKMEVAERLDKEKHNGHINSVNTLLWLNNHTLVTAGDDRAIIVWKIFD